MEQREREKAQMDTDMGMDYRDADADLSLQLHTDSKALRVAIIAGVSFVCSLLLLLDPFLCPHQTHFLI
jgi:hypothetical protein